MNHVVSVRRSSSIAKSAFVLLAFTMACSFSAGTAQASRDEERHERLEERHEERGERYEEIKFYGSVEAMPQSGLDGTWKIGGREVVVNRNTVIKEEYGKVAIGVQVEVKGGGGSPFVAYEIETKSSGR